MKISYLILIVLVLCNNNPAFTQGCCSGGGNNPLAGGVASGVLAKGEVELAMSNVYSQSNRFLTGDSYSDPYFEKLVSNYLFFRSDIGISDKLTFSSSLGYFTNRTIYEHKDDIANKQRLVSSKGIGDLILLPRYKVFNKQKNGITSELDLGLGVKLPLGRHNDSISIGQSYFVNMTGNKPFLDSTEIWQIAPPLVQATTGSNDLMAYLFYMHNNKNKRFNFYVSGMYMHRGWNSLGIKFGDFASIGLFLGKSLTKRVNVLGQVRGEWIGKIRTHDKIDYLATYNIDQASTGSRALYFSPQISYSIKKFNFFTIADIPMYQYLKGTQVVLPHQLTVGITYRFNPNLKAEVCEDPLPEVAP
jgi:hypothetical protein